MSIPAFHNTLNLHWQINVAWLPARKYVFHLINIFVIFRPAPKNEDEMMVAIFEYIDRFVILLSALTILIFRGTYNRYYTVG